MDKPKVTPKDFFLWAGAMIALYVSVFSLLALLFSYIDRAYPDALNYNYDPYSSGMRFAIASLIVLFPLFLYLMRLVRKDISRDASKSELWIRRWALVLTVFIAGATVAGDLIALINYFLGGDLTTRFVLKVVVVLLVIGAAFLHFLADIRGYWLKFPERARMVGWGAGVLILVSIVAGFFIMGTPGQVRLYRFDDQKVQDLQNIQYQIVNYWQQKEKLPTTLSDLADPLSSNTIPVDPQSGETYSYSTARSMSFTLCATFNAETQPNSATVTYPRAVAPAPAGVKGVDLEAQPWTHAAGNVCFTRTIDPQRYPPFNKK
ncbi:hypothetical protein HY968_01690 [Candidatus Kaiserbacteria bacterium]|nr:hypothetical protein [Candidatus Kaiserbacteria bacterium]